MNTVPQDGVRRRDIARQLEIGIRQTLRLMQRKEHPLEPMGFAVDGRARYARAQADTFVRLVKAARESRGEYRSRALGACAKPVRRDDGGRRICARDRCREIVVRRRKLCDAHRNAGLNDQRLNSSDRGRATW